MRVSFNGETASRNVFSEISKPAQRYSNIRIAASEPDKVELSTVKQNIKKHRKLILGVCLAALAAAAVVCAVICKKNASKIISSASSPGYIPGGGFVPDYLTGQDDTLILRINNAREHLIDDVVKKGETGFSGICFFGPESANKEKIIEGFVEELGQSGYKIDRMPTLKDADRVEIGHCIGEAIDKAKKLFETKGQRSAIVIRDLDKVAPNRGKSRIFDVSRPLINNIQYCGKQGYTVVGEAVNILDVDEAVCRSGRMSMSIFLQPAVDEPKEVWQRFVEFVKTGVSEKVRDELTKKGMEIISKK